MIKSMTGYGGSRRESEGIKIHVEVKSLNSKFLDPLIKLPKEFSDKELEVKSLIGEVLKRGKISMTVEYESENGASSLKINESVFKDYYDSLKALAEKTNDSTDHIFEMVMQFPDVTIPTDNLPTEKEWSLVLSTINEAVNSCDQHRITEGDKLLPTVKDSLLAIQERLKKVELADPQRIDGIKSRISGNLKEHLGSTGIDENRFEQEVIYFIEKLDINEEKVRLQSHLNYFMDVLNGDTSQGKKLGFIGQEIGREINTIGSKANNATIQHLVVEMKEELEKIKEQLLNIL